MSKIKLSIKPVKEFIESAEPQTGVKFRIAALSGERDHEIQRECSDLMGNINTQLHAEKVCAECIKGWDAVEPCNAENIKTFVKWHGQGVAQWVVRRARSIEHYVTEEIEAAKNV